MDGLKKTKEGARNAIKWLESEFQKGNRFMRTQRESESLQMMLLKVPSKLGKSNMNGIQLDIYVSKNDRKFQFYC